MTLICVACVLDTRAGRIPHDRPATAVYDGASLCAEHLAEQLRVTTDAFEGARS